MLTSNVVLPAAHAAGPAFTPYASLVGDSAGLGTAASRKGVTAFAWCRLTLHENGDHMTLNPVEFLSIFALVWPS